MIHKLGVSAHLSVERLKRLKRVNVDGPECSECDDTGFIYKTEGGFVGVIPCDQCRTIETGKADDDDPFESKSE